MKTLYYFSFHKINNSFQEIVISWPPSTRNLYLSFPYTTIKTIYKYV